MMRLVQFIDETGRRQLEYRRKETTFFAAWTLLRASTRFRRKQLNKA